MLMTKIIDWDDRIGRRIKLRDLRVFFAVVECGSMAKAAALFRITQPAVSQAIVQLEHALAVKLLDRSSPLVGSARNSISLTPSRSSAKAARARLSSVRP